MKVREKDRVSVNLVCCFQKAKQRYTGRVKNMSRIGILTVWNPKDWETAAPIIGETWQVEIELPVHDHFAPNAFYCDAMIVRVGPATRTKREVAFRIDRMKAADLKSRATKPAPPSVPTKQVVM